jgi:hypothetical protein
VTTSRRRSAEQLEQAAAEGEAVHEEVGSSPEADDSDTDEVLRIAALDDTAEPTSRFLVFGPTKRVLAQVKAERERRERAWRVS